MRPARLALVFAVVALGACKEKEAKLFGSIGELYPLDFDSARIRKQETDLVIDYLKTTKQTVEKPCRLVVETAELNIQPGVTISDALFAQSVTVSRVMVNGETFPELDRGELDFKTYEFRGGGKLAGEFFVMFQNGRDLYGVFDGEVQEVVGE